MEASRLVAIAVLPSLGEVVVLLHLPTLLFLEPPHILPLFTYHFTLLYILFGENYDMHTFKK